MQQLDSDRFEQLMSAFSGFDFIVGGSPCNNLAGSNKVCRNGLEGSESSLFYDYFRILDLVKVMALTTLVYYLCYVKNRLCSIFFTFVQLIYVFLMKEI
jgi:hypothetical protein